jgi:hypothetical protein
MMAPTIERPYETASAPAWVKAVRVAATTFAACVSIVILFLLIERLDSSRVQKRVSSRRVPSPEGYRPA